MLLAAGIFAVSAMKNSNNNTHTLQTYNVIFNVLRAHVERYVLYDSGMCELYFCTANPNHSRELCSLKILLLVKSRCIKLRP
jgi:hypothetical protein